MLVYQPESPANRIKGSRTGGWLYGSVEEWVGIREYVPWMVCTAERLTGGMTRYQVKRAVENLSEVAKLLPSTGTRWSGAGIEHWWSSVGLRRAVQFRVGGPHNEEMWLGVECPQSFAGHKQITRAVDKRFPRRFRWVEKQKAKEAVSLLARLIARSCERKVWTEMPGREVSIEMKEIIKRYHPNNTTGLEALNCAVIRMCEGLDERVQKAALKLLGVANA